MMHLVTCDSPFSLNHLASQIRKSSNFLFGGQFYQCSGVDPHSSADIRQALEVITATPELHRFLQEPSRRSFRPGELKVKTLHKHCQVVATDRFETILASAASDYLGAYGQRPEDASAVEKRDQVISEKEQVIKELFGCIGEYLTYELLFGTIDGCPVCRTDGHLFSNWFFRMGWQWCLFAIWPSRNLLWIGCLTDID
jgi:hypothetical protein